MFDQLNLYLFSLINSAPGLEGWRLHGAVFAAEWVIMILPLGLVLMWMHGDTAGREAAVRAFMAAVIALTLNKMIGLAWFHPRPFMAEVGQTFMFHAPDSSFPSDHGTSMFSVALALAFGPLIAARRFGIALLVLGVVVAWARVFLGVHWPLDMAGALVTSGLAAVLVNTRTGQALAALVVPQMQVVYRRVLRTPIKRGWLRP